MRNVGVVFICVTEGLCFLPAGQRSWYQTRRGGANRPPQLYTRALHPSARRRVKFRATETQSFCTVKLYNYNISKHLTYSYRTVKACSRVNLSDVGFKRLWLRCEFCSCCVEINRNALCWLGVSQYTDIIYNRVNNISTVGFCMLFI